MAELKVKLNPVSPDAVNRTQVFVSSLGYNWPDHVAQLFAEAAAGHISDVRGNDDEKEIQWVAALAHAVNENKEKSFAELLALVQIFQAIGREELAQPVTESTNEAK